VNDVDGPTSSARADAAPDPSVATDHAGLRVMGLDECLTRMAGAAVGRLAFPLDGEIAVLPVNHVLRGMDVCFRTSGASKIQAAVDGDTASVVTDEQVVTALAGSARSSWVPLDPRTTRWVRVSTRQVTGRMILSQ
jgi:uncharacterized protein